MKPSWPWISSGSAARRRGGTSRAEDLRRITAIRVEPESDDGAAVDDPVRLDREDARRHGREVDVGVGDLRPDRRNDVANGSDSHGDPALSGVEIAARAPSSRALLVMPSHLFDTSRVPIPGRCSRSIRSPQEPRLPADARGRRMKLASFRRGGEAEVGVLEGDRLWPVHALGGHPVAGMLDLIRRFGRPTPAWLATAMALPSGASSSWRRCRVLPQRLLRRQELPRAREGVREQRLRCHRQRGGSRSPGRVFEAALGGHRSRAPIPPISIPRTRSITRANSPS